MRQPVKRYSFIIVSLLLMTSTLAACTNFPQSGDMGPYRQGDSVGSCKAESFPRLTTRTALASSTQSIYFVSGVHLYALNAGNGAIHWCMYASNSNSNQQLQGTISRLRMPSPPDGLTALTVNGAAIYATSLNGYTYAFNATSGRMLWHQNTGGDNTSAPTVGGNTVYIGSGNVYALDAHSGTVHWQFPTPDVVTSSPVLVNGFLYFGSYGNRVYALDAASGKKRWEYPTGGRVYVAPVIDQGEVYFGAGDDQALLSALNAQNGQRLWSLSTPIDGNSSLLAAHGLLYVQINHRLFALNEHNGTAVWQSPVGSPIRSLLVNGILYASSFDNGLYAFNAQNGRLLWHNPLNKMGAGVTTAPVLLNGTLFVETIDEGGNPSQSSQPRQAILHALDARNGIENWYASVAWNISTIDVAASGGSTE